MPTVREWMRASLVATHKAKLARPACERIRKRATDVFGVAGISKDLATKHLREHEPAWRLWDAEAAGA